MEKSLAIAFVLSCSVFCASYVRAQDKDTLRILSYNIKHGAGMDGKVDLERLAKVIESESPDIVSLQEVDNKASRSGNVEQAKELARLLGMDYVFGRAINLGAGQYGNAVLTKLPIQKSEIISLPGAEKRSALCVTLKTSDQDSADEFVFIATHFALGEKHRIESVSLINELFDDDKNLPAILAGDINAQPGSPTMESFEMDWENATSQEGLLTFPADKPIKQIDYILYRPLQGYKVLESRVVEEAFASDHRPILAVLQFDLKIAEKNKSF